MSQVQAPSETPSGGNRRFVYVVAVVAALGGLLFGYDTGVISGALLYIKDDLALSSFMEGVVVSSLLVGAMIGAGIGGPLADRMGRRMLVLIAAVIFAVGALGAGLSPSVGALVFFRVVLGLGVGVASAMVPTYISEMAPTDVRGSLSALFQLAITFGILTAYLTNFAFAGAEAWRWMLGLGLVPAVILFAGMYFLPETPRWLVKHGQRDLARETLTKIHDSADVEDELEEIQNIEAQEQEQSGMRELFSSWVRPMIVAGLGLAIFQQLVGINTIIYYAPTIISRTGLEAQTAILATVGVGLVNFLMTFVAIWLIDRVGRKPLLEWGLAGMISALVILGLGFFLPSLAGVVAWVTLFGLLLYIASFAASFGPVLWVMLPEIFPLKVRGVAVGVATIGNWGANFVVSLTFPVLIAALGDTPVFWMYAAISVVALLFVRYLVPETRGRSLERIEADLKKSRA